MKGQRTSIYNSSGYTDTQDMFLAIPIVMVAAPVSAVGAAITPLAGFSNTMTLKPNFQTLIHSAELVGSGKTIHDVQSHIAIYNGFKMMSGMTTSDLAQWGSSLGLGNELESEKSAVWNATAAAAGTRQSGVGFCLNRAAVSATQGGSDTMNLVDATGQNAGAINKSLQRRMSRVIDTTLNNAGYNRIYGTSTANNLTLLTAEQLAREFKPYYTTVAGRGIWYDVAICPLKYLFSAMGSIGLTKRSDFVLRLYLNTGTLQVAITDAQLATQGLGAISTNTFQNAVPFTINHIPSANNGFPTATAATSLVCGVFVAKALPTSITCNGGQIDLSTGVGSHFLQSCRVYYSQVKLAPAIETSYALENRQKQVVYENVMFNQYNAIAPAQNFAQLVSSGVKDPLYCLIIPLIGPQTLTTFGSTVATLGLDNGNRLTIHVVEANHFPHYHSHR